MLRGTDGLMGGQDVVVGVGRACGFSRDFGFQSLRNSMFWSWYLG